MKKRMGNLDIHVDHFDPGEGGIGLAIGMTVDYYVLQASFFKYGLEIGWER